MIRFYYIQIKLGNLSINDVPIKWREQVQQLLDNEE